MSNSGKHKGYNKIQVSGSKHSSFILWSKSLFNQKSAVLLNETWVYMAGYGLTKTLITCKDKPQHNF